MDSKINILIAEDEENIALALNTIISKATGATITVVNNGKQALDAAFKTPFQLIVSDWNMPEMTGIELLTELRNQQTTKSIPFLMLTARGDKPSVMSALKGGVTGYLTKPFEKQDVIARINALLGSTVKLVEEDEPDDISIESLSIKLRSGDIEFPIFPEIGMKAVELTKSDSVTMEELAALIQQDSALTSKLLLIANSPHYRGNRRFDNIEDSLMRIGLRDTSNLILAITNKSLYKNIPGVIGERLNNLWEHSFATGACARVIARQLDLMYPDRLFAMGLLHDIGKLALLTVVGAISKNRNITLEALDELLNGLHVEFGKSLVKSWNMPAEFIDVVSNHHDLDSMENRPSSTQVVTMANILVRRLGKSLIADDGTDLSKTELAKLLWLTDDMIEDILVKTNEYIEAHRNSI